ncbi:hypothetical protein MKW98_015092, partial [Papaver atlanticum]
MKGPMIAFCLAFAAPLLLLHSCVSTRNKSNSRQLPPGPPDWPIIGNLLDLGYHYKAPHKRLVQLQKKYGHAAMELFKSHDQAFSNRYLGEVLKSTGDEYGPTSLLSPNGPIWRMNRRLYATIFSRTSIKNTLGRRRQFVDQMIQWISLKEKEGRSVEIRHLTFEIGVLSTKPNVADFFPWLRKLDPQNLASRTKKAVYALQNIIEELVKERKSRDIVLHNHHKEKDFLDLLMDFEVSGKDEPRKMSDRHINAF